jgi:hypothetical protein
MFVIFSPIRATSPAHHITQFKHPKTFYEKQELTRSLLCSFLQLPDKCSFLGPISFLALYSRTQSAYVPHSMWHPNFHTNIKLCTFYLVTFTFLRKQTLRRDFYNLLLRNITVGRSFMFKYFFYLLISDEHHTLTYLITYLFIYLFTYLLTYILHGAETFSRS